MGKPAKIPKTMIKQGCDELVLCWSYEGGCALRTCSVVLSVSTKSTLEGMGWFFWIEYANSIVSPRLRLRFLQVGYLPSSHRQAVLVVCL